jgi:sugar phosphate isomerase/epimerase
MNLRESMKKIFTRRDFVRSAGLLTAGLATSGAELSLAQNRQATKPSPIWLGLASYTFRNFSRAQMIGFMKQLNVPDLNAKNVKDHLPMDSAEEAAALAAYADAGINLHAAGAISFANADDADVQSKFEYCKRAGIGVIVAGDPTPDNLPRIERFARQYDIRIAIHNHGPEDKLWASPLDILKAIRTMDARMGCCIDVGHTVRAGTDVVQAIRAVGPRLFNVHMKDLADPHDKESQVAVGQGILPIPKIFKALLEVNYRGFVDLEYEIHPDDPMPGVISSFAFMRGVISGMGS